MFELFQLKELNSHIIIYSSELKAFVGSLLANNLLKMSNIHIKYC